MNDSLTVVPTEVIRDNLTQYLCDKSCFQFSATNRTYYDLYQNSDFAKKLWEVFFHKRWPRIESDHKFEPPRESRNKWISRYNYQTEQDAETRSQIMEFYCKYRYRSSNPRYSSEQQETWSTILKKGDLALDVVYEMCKHARNSEKIFLNNVLEAISKASVLGRIERTTMEEINRWPIEKLPIMLAKCFDWESFVHRNLSSLNTEDYIERELDSLANHVRTHLLHHHSANTDGRFHVHSILETMKIMFSPLETNQDLRCLERNFPIRYFSSHDASLPCSRMPFRGNTIDYYASSNSMIHKVLYFRMGIPITLSIIYSSIVKRATGVELQPIGLPGHFLLGAIISNEITGQMDRIFIDVFDGGSILTKEKVQQLVLPFGISWDDSFLKPISNMDICRRMLRNLSNCPDLTPYDEENVKSIFHTLHQKE